MTIVAVSSGGMFWVIAALVFGLIKHLADSAAAAKKSPPTTGSLGRPRGPESPDPMSEEERTRKFLEALGLPARGQLKPITQKRDGGEA